jgi:two-component system sensor histidine kinase RegB
VAALGSIAAGAAHELGTPLGTIQMLTEEFSSMTPEEQSEALKSIASELQRCKHIVDEMENPELAASSAGHKGPWPVADLSRHIPASLPGIEEGVVVCCESGAENLSNQPEAAIARVLREALANAADSCRAKGEGQSARIVVTLSSDPQRATVRVSDNGAGLASGSERGAFEPFFSTKAEGRGLGLFLARVHLTQLGGSIHLTPRATGGAELEFGFPLRRRGEDSTP